MARDQSICKDVVNGGQNTLSRFYPFVILKDIKHTCMQLACTAQCIILLIDERKPKADNGK